MIKIREYLRKLDIKFVEHKHPPVYTSEQAEKYHKNIMGVHSKNLFIKNRKPKKYYLVIIPFNEKFDFNKFEMLLDDKLKFVNEEDLKNILGVISGAVSPFALINDKEHKVQILIDKRVWESYFVSFHPNINTETLELSRPDFHKYIKSLNNKLIII
ncbi:MAG: YbaK/EbsC family protein [Candidatus Pacearchaeota archaeon]